MSTIGKKDISYRRKDRATDRVLSVGFEPIVFAHEFASAGQTDIDLTALSVPGDMTGFVNPSLAKLLGAHIYAYPNRVELVSSSKGKLMSYLSYDIVSNTVIRLKDGLESDIGEVIIGTITPVPIQGVPIADAKQIVQTGTLAIGATDFLVNEYFEVNKYSDQQMGDVVVIRDGLIQMRNAGNAVSGQGNYYEVPPVAGRLSNTIRFNLAPTTAAANIVVVSNGLKSERPQEGSLARVESLAAQMDIVVQDLAVTTGNPVTRYQAAPNNVDTLMFGEKVNAILTDVFSDIIVGPQAYVDGGYATHTTVQGAIDSASSGQKITVLEGTYTENLTINKKVMIEGKGHGSFVNGTVSFGGGADYSLVKWIKIGGNITFSFGADGIFLRECWTSTGVTVTDLGAANSLLVIQE